MKTSLTYLPEHIQNELKEITGIIVSMVHPTMIILFGSYGRGDYVEQHRYTENGITYEYRSDYDILVITKKAYDVPPGFTKEVRRRIKKAFNLDTTPHIIFHDLKYVNNQLSNGQYFFVDIVKDGTILHNPDDTELAEPRILSAQERAEQSQQYYDSWFSSAGEFMIDYGHAYSRGSYPKAIFELHQAAERYMMTILLVYTHYKPKTHDLDKLYRNICYEDARFKVIFPNQEDEEKRLFELLVKAYIDSRYVLGYTVSPADLQWLSTRVQLLQQLTEEICKEKIASFV